MGLKEFGSVGGRATGGEPEWWLEKYPATKLRTHANPVPHYCGPTSAPTLNRFCFFYISFLSSSFFYLPTGYPSRPHACAR